MSILPSLELFIIGFQCITISKKRHKSQLRQFFFVASITPPPRVPLNPREITPSPALEQDIGAIAWRQNCCCQHPFVGEG